MTGTASSTAEGWLGQPLRRTALHLLPVLLVAGFANAYEAWRFLGDLARPEIRGALPFVAVGMAALVGAIVRPRRCAGLAVREAFRGWIAAAAVAAAIGLAVADPAYPAKRIHVGEYMLLAIV